jgi:hypothetical protein
MSTLAGVPLKVRLAAKFPQIALRSIDAILKTVAESGRTCDGPQANSVNFLYIPHSLQLHIENAQCIHGKTRCGYTGHFQYLL